MSEYTKEQEDCATSCEATDAGVTVVHPEGCEPLCVASDGGVDG